jgi:hypothetical protein
MRQGTPVRKLKHLATGQEQLVVSSAVQVLAPTEMERISGGKSFRPLLQDFGFGSVCLSSLKQ